MRKSSIWILDVQDLQKFENYKIEKYKSYGIKGEINDDILTKYYTYFIIFFFRKLKISKENPFRAQKFIHTAVYLYKRFYLVNEYADNTHPQNLLCCIYLSLKINEVPQEEIVEYARTWKANDTIFLNEGCLHFKDQGYSDRQIYFLRGIGFQVGRSPIVPALQSLNQLIKSKISNKELILQVETEIKEITRRVYADKRAIFLYPGPRLGLAIVLCSLKSPLIQPKLDFDVEELFRGSVPSVFKNHYEQINTMIQHIKKIQRYDHRLATEEVKQLKQRLITAKKKVFEIPEKKSPKIAPLTFEFDDLNY